MRIYLAGKVRSFKNEWPLKWRLVRGFKGADFIASDGWGDMPHCWESNPTDIYGFNDAPHMIEVHCLHAILASDLILACVDSQDVYGTLVEIGYASAHGKDVILALVGEYFQAYYEHQHPPKGTRRSPMADAFWFAAAMPRVELIHGTTEGELRALLWARLGKQAYRSYLRSAHWQDVRNRALSRAGGKCQLCAKTAKLQVHHNTYDHMGAELDADVIVLCDDCHSRHHAKKENA